MAAPPPAVREISPQVFLFLAGDEVRERVPPLGTAVYYYPEGHAEQARDRPAFPPRFGHRYPSRFSRSVANIAFFVDKTGEPFARLQLGRVGDVPAAAVPAPDLFAGGDAEYLAYERKKMNQNQVNGKSLELPAGCVSSIFGDLNPGRHVVNIFSLCAIEEGQGDQSMQFTVVKRANGKGMLEGWHRFVQENSFKDLDTLVFLREVQTGRVYMYNRRRKDPLKIIARQAHIEFERGGGWESCGRMPPKNVQDALAMAFDDAAVFTVEYYPGWCSEEFVVPTEKVHASELIEFVEGTQVKVRRQEYTDLEEGVVTGIANSEVTQFEGSKWRCIRVLDRSRRAMDWSPWHLEKIGSPPRVPPPTPADSKRRIHEDGGAGPSKKSKGPDAPAANLALQLV